MDSFIVVKEIFMKLLLKKKILILFLITEMYPNYWKDEGNKRYTLITSKELNSLFFQDSNFYNGKNISENVDKFINNCYESYVFSRK